MKQLLEPAAPAQRQEQISPAKKEESKKELMVVVYLPKKIAGGGPRDGSAPTRVSLTLKKLQLGVVYPEIERQLLKVQLSHPRGDYKIQEENNRKWMAVLNKFLVDKATMYSINGGKARYSCGARCLDEEEGNYQFVDSGRFALEHCVHASMHLQCIASFFIGGDGYTYCPI